MIDLTATRRSKGRYDVKFPDQQDSESWASAVVEWIVALVRGLMRANVGSGGAHNPAVPGATPGPATKSVAA